MIKVAACVLISIVRKMFLRRSGRILSMLPRAYDSRCFTFIYLPYLDLVVLTPFVYAHHSTSFQKLDYSSILLLALLYPISPNGRACQNCRAAVVSPGTLYSRGAPSAAVLSRTLFLEAKGGDTGPSCDWPGKEAYTLKRVPSDVIGTSGLRILRRLVRLGPLQIFRRRERVYKTLYQSDKGYTTNRSPWLRISAHAKLTAGTLPRCHYLFIVLLSD